MAICLLRLRPVMSPNFSRSTQPANSGLVGGKFFADKGRNNKSSAPDDAAIIGIVFLRCDLGRCPITSPVMMKSKLFSFIHCLAFFTMKILQSRQGFKLA